MTLKRHKSRSQDFLIKYLEYEEIYNVGLQRGQIGNDQYRLSIGPMYFDPAWGWKQHTLGRYTFQSIQRISRYFSMSIDLLQKRVFIF